MKEQSHKDEMSAAIRGDFQRLRERGVSATLAPQEPATAAPPPAPALEQEPEVRAGPDEPVPDGATVEAAEEEITEPPAPAAEETAPAEKPEEAPAAEEEPRPAAPRPGWLSRLVSR